MKKSAPNNSQHRGDYAYATQLTQWMFVPLGLWPVSTSSAYWRMRPFLIGLTFLAVMFVFVPMCCFTHEFALNIKIQMKLAGQISFSIINLFKFFVTVYRKDEIVRLINTMASDWQKVESPKHRRVMLEFAKFGRTLTIICLLLIYSGGFLFIAIVPRTKPPLVVGNLTMYYLPYPAHFYFFNPRVKPMYDVIFTMQCMAAAIRLAINCSLFSIVIILVMHVCGQIVLTSALFEDLMENFTYQKLGKIIRSHLHFADFAKKVEDIFSEVFLAEVFSSTFMICLMGYYFLTEYEESKDPLTIFTYVMLLISFTFNIFILCYVGQVLQQHCEDIGDTTYNTSWYELTPRQAWHLLLLVSVKQRPVNLTAGKMMNLSLGTFIKIIKTAGGSLNMLRNMIARSKAISSNY